jgi:hypothetical protein
MSSQEILVDEEEIEGVQYIHYTIGNSKYVENAPHF